VIRSMTGYGEAATHAHGVHYFLEVRSLNGKYFKATVRLPDDLQGLEAELESMLRKRLSRGSITLVAKCSDASEEAAFVINHHALNSYIEQLEQAPKVGDGSCQIDTAALLALPGVLQPPSDEEKRIERARESYSGLLEIACVALREMRVKEGAIVRDDLLQNLVVIREHLGEIAERAPKVVEEYQSRLQTRIESLLSAADLNVEPSDLIREVAVFAEKSDIAEEVARLSGHLDQFGNMLNEEQPKPIGRTLDFISQEMLREANTIASKSGDVEISRHIVQVKGAIDRIKEQVQNVE
jgi:uncharacterized protein (TIGR00255 family)